jgi:multiple sugar transport system ATP-binding protein
MNFLRGKLVNGDGDPAFVLEHGGRETLLRLPTKALRASGLTGYIGREIILGIRPEHVTDTLSLSNGHHGGYRPTEVDCTVELTEPTGPDTLVTAQFNGAPIICRTHPRAGAVPNQALTLAFDLSKALLFDPVSENRIG